MKVERRYIAIIEPRLSARLSVEDGFTMDRSEGGKDVVTRPNDCNLGCALGPCLPGTGAPATISKQVWHSPYPKLVARKSKRLLKSLQEHVLPLKRQIDQKKR